MARIQILLSVLCLFLSPAARADLTLRYVIEVKSSPYLPVPSEKTETSIRVKGDKVWSSFTFTSFKDLSTGQITLLNLKTKSFATIPMGAYPPRVQTPHSLSLSEDVRKSFENMKLNVESRKTGRGGMLLGIRAEEQETIVSLDAPVSRNGPAGLKIVSEQWVAVPGETGRIPALQEFAGYSAKARGAINLADTMQRAFALLPTVGEQFRGAFEELSS